MGVVEVGERIHLIERRSFPDDVRRHFIGEVRAVADGAIRVMGYLFVYDTSASRFVRKPELRTRVIAIDNRVIINVLPNSVDVYAIRFDLDSERNLCLVDDSGFELDISEFSARE